MRKIIFLLTALVTATFCYSQSISQINSKEDAIAILTHNNLFDILRYPADSVANVDRFVREINQVIPLDPQKSNQLKAQLLSVLQKKEGFSEHWSLLYWPVEQTPILGTNIRAVLKDNFSNSEYEKITSQISNKLSIAQTAYRFLVSYQRERQSEEDRMISFSSNAEYLKQVYEYFGI